MAARSENMTKATKSSTLNIENQVKRIIEEILFVDIQNIGLSDHLGEDLSADSLDHVEMVMRFEEEFDLEIPDEDAEGLITVRACIDYITKAKA